MAKKNPTFVIASSYYKQGYGRYNEGVEQDLELDLEHTFKTKEEAMNRINELKTEMLEFDDISLDDKNLELEEKDDEIKMQYKDCDDLLVLNHWKVFSI